MSSMARYVDWSRRPMGANVVAGAAPGGWRPTPMNSRTRNRSRHSEYRKVRRWLVSTWLRLSRAGRGLRSAQDEPGLLLGLFHQHGAGDERQGLLSLERERRRRAGGEPELVGATAAGEPEVPVDPEGRRQADGLFVDADAGDTPRRGRLDRVRHVAGLGQRDLERVEPGPVRVQEELGGAASDPRAVVGPAGGELRDAGDEGGRRHGLGRQDQRARVLGTARGLLWVEAPARRREHGGRAQGDHRACEPSPPPHANTVQLLTITRSATSATRSTPAVLPTRRTLHRWMETGRRSGARARNSPTRSRPSCLSMLRSCVGLATPRAAAKASAMSSSVNHSSACSYTRLASLFTASTSIMFARSTACRHGDGRTWTKNTSITRTLPLRTMRFAGLMSRWASPTSHIFRTIWSPSSMPASSISASPISTAPSKNSITIMYSRSGVISTTPNGRGVASPTS